MDSLHFKQTGGQHLPECHTALKKQHVKSFQLFTGGGGQYAPDYPIITIFIGYDFANDSLQI
jgi:hypothetical protein